MLTAFYYPHTSLSEELVKNALFLWDKIEYIAPYTGYVPWYENKELGEAVQPFSIPRVPTDSEKQQIDEAVTELLESRLPDWFYVENVSEKLHYDIYAEKLLDKTWEKLREHRLAQSKVIHGVTIQDRYQTATSLGLALMSICADFCAGTEKRLITDEASSYSALNRYLLTIGGGELGKYDDRSERLVSISLNVMNLKNVSLKRLVELREKENSSNGSSLRALRHGYLSRIEQYSDRLAKAKNKTDEEEIERIFEQEMQDDFNLLKDELKDEAKKVIFSKEMAIAIVALAGTTVAPTPGLLVAGGSLYHKKIEYHAARNKILKTHPTAVFT